MATDLRQALTEGVIDAVGFVSGALIGWQLGKALGHDVLANADPDSRNVLGWILLLAGCGAGKWASLRWRALQAAQHGRGDDRGDGPATSGPKK
jgi:hypothetical protein